MDRTMLSESLIQFFVVEWGCVPSLLLDLRPNYGVYKSWVIRKYPDARKDWRKEDKGQTENEMVGWHYGFNEHDFEQFPGDGEGQATLQIMVSQRVVHNWPTEQKNAGKIYSCDFSVFLDWSLNHCVVFFDSCKSLYFKVYFVWWKYHCSFPIDFYFHGIIFHPFTFRLCVSLILKWDSCRQYIYGLFLISIYPLYES